MRPAAGAGALEGLLEHGAEGDEGVGAGGVAAVSLAASQQHYLQHTHAAKQRVKTSHVDTGDSQRFRSCQGLRSELFAGGGDLNAYHVSRLRLTPANCESAS